MVAGCNRDIGAGLDVRAVGRNDLVRVVAQKPRRPKAVTQVMPLLLELGGEAAVEHDDPLIKCVCEASHQEGVLVLAGYRALAARRRAGEPRALRTVSLSGAFAP